MKNKIKLCAFLLIAISIVLVDNAEALRIKTKWAKRVDLSSKVLVGEVIDVTSYWDNAGIIKTDVTFIVDEHIKGIDDFATTVTITIPGGTVGDVTLQVTETPHFKVGDYGVVLLQSNGQVTGGPDGFYPFKKPDAKTQKLQLEHRFLTWIKAYVKQETSDGFEDQEPEIVPADASPAASGGESAYIGVITGVSPSSISAGTGSEITINGSGFGASRGTGNFPTIAFRYLDTSYMYNNSEIVFWSNTQIRARVWTGIVNGYNHSPGSFSDTVAFVNSTPAIESFWPLTITFGYGRMKWPSPACSYYNNTTGGPSGASTAIQNAANTWNGAPSAFTFNYSGTTTSGIGYDGRNVVSFANLGDPNIIAQAGVWYSGTTISEADIQFNTVFPFSTATPCPSDRMDLETIALHELGHWLNLCDLYGDNDTAKVMYGYGSYGQIKRARTSDDTAGINWIYPGGTTTTTTSITTTTTAITTTTTTVLSDLTVLSITPNPASPCTGQNAEVTVTVKNQGAVAAGRFYVTFFQDSATTPPMCDAGTYYWDIAGGLSAGATTNLTTTITYGAAGTFKMWAIADACTEVAETNENNNMLSKDISVPTCGSPDLTVKSITTTPPFPNNGDVVSVDILFANLGPVNAPYGFSLDFYKNRGTPPSLGEAGDTSEAFPPNMPCCGFEYHMYTQVVYDACGSYNMWAQIDTYNNNAEENETNNVFGSQNISILCVCPNYDIIRPMVREYYLAILDREPDGPGWDFWTDDICRITTDQGCQLIDKLGIYIGEGFQALARLHFNSPEYIGKGKTNTAFLTDCYEVFMERSPDTPGLTFWLNQMSQGYTRNMVITSFANSPEYKAILASSFGIDTTRPENNLLNDLYRGFLNVFPDADGFKYYLNLMRDAQCAGNPVALKNLCAQIAFTFTHSAQYAGRGRDNSGFVEDLYNAILRRGADAPGFLFWVGVLNGGTSRDTVLQEFINSPEFQGRVQTVVAAGCCNTSQCQPQQCGTYTFDCSPGNPNCACAEIAEGGGSCASDFSCVTAVPCPNGTVDCPAGQKCYVNTCCGAPACGPAECSAPSSAEASLEGELTAFGVTPVAPADKNPW